MKSNNEDGFPLERMPPEPDDIILQSGMRAAVEKTEDGMIRLMFSRPVYFVDLSPRNAKLIRDEIDKHISLIIT